MTDVQQIKAELDGHESRIKALEAGWAETMTFVAVREERDKHLDRRFDSLEKGMNEVKGYLLKIVWVIIIGIVIGLLTFIMSGGLTMVPSTLSKPPMQINPVLFDLHTIPT